MENILVKFVEKIESMCMPNIIQRDGRSYTDKRLNPIKLPEYPMVSLSTLEGLSDYIKNINKDIANVPAPLLLQVHSYDRVTLSTPVYGPFNQRDVLAEVEAQTPSFGFGNWHDQEAFIINLNSKFLPTDDLNMVRRVASVVVDQEEVKQEDDGISQRVTMKTGVTKVADETVKSIVSLQPFRTFLEVEQPKSDFLLRIRKGGSFAMYEADGGAWKIEAARNIYDYLVERKEEFIESGQLIVVM